VALGKFWVEEHGPYRDKKVVSVFVTIAASVMKLTRTIHKFQKGQ
jgi:hypothetical protein